MNTPKQTKIQLKGRSRRLRMNQTSVTGIVKICQRNQQVRDRVQPDQPGVPEIAEAVWLEVTRAEKLPQEIQGSPATTPVTKAP